jgi:hypothetical protein
MEALQVQPKQFSNVQLELLKLFSYNFPETDLLELKKIITRYMAEKASDWADNIWDEKQLSDAKILKKHKRTPYKRGN